MMAELAAKTGHVRTFVQCMRLQLAKPLSARSHRSFESTMSSACGMLPRAIAVFASPNESRRTPIKSPASRPRQPADQARADS